MSIRKDIEFGDVDGRYDVIFKNGDFSTTQSDIQHIRHIIEADQGQFKEFPKIGLGIRKYLNTPIDGEMKRTALIMLNADGYNTLNVRQIEGGLIIRI